MSIYGWECPKCGNCYSPTTQRCFECQKSFTGEPREGMHGWNMDNQKVPMPDRADIYSNLPNTTLLNELSSNGNWLSSSVGTTTWVGQILGLE